MFWKEPTPASLILISRELTFTDFCLRMLYINFRSGFWLRIEKMVPVLLSTTGRRCILFSSRIRQASISLD